MNKLLASQRRTVLAAAAMILFTTALNLSAPSVIAHAIDGPLTAGDYRGVLRHAALLLVMYLASLNTQYRQTLWMGGVAQRILHGIRAEIFDKLQELDLAYFQRHRTGDLISRINSDTDKVHLFLSQSLMQFLGAFATMLGAGFFLVGLNPRLGLAALMPAAGMLLLTRLLNPWIKRRNASSLKSTGDVSAQISESLTHFHVMLSFDRRDYFRAQFEQVNEQNFRQALQAGLANGMLAPLYAFCSQLGQLIVLAYGLHLVAQGQFTLGLLIGYFVYVLRFYDPMRQLAALWANLQAAIAAYDRISEVLREKSELQMVAVPEANEANPARLEFRSVDFGYQAEQHVLKGVDFRLEEGKTYAFVGPTGGGKTTTASLMARLYDPTQGTVLLDGQDLRGYDAAQRARRIGFILQEPFLFTSTVGDNIDDLRGLDRLFPKGLETPVAGLSLGQRQVVAFLRALSREPDLLILDEATANIDTVTEGVLQGLLDSLPRTTTLVVIAHRLSTIEKADAIFFVNAGRVQSAGSMEQAVALLKEEARRS